MAKDAYRKMIIQEYLNRINYVGRIKINRNTLYELHKHHVLSIPFEDLDIHWKIPIKLDVASIYDKVVLRNRGGFCYELNYLFNNFLKKIGFESQIISSRIYGDHENLGPEFDHMSIIVKLEENWLLDVGYGDLFIEPIKIKDNHYKKDWFKTYRLNKTGATTYLLSESRNGKEFKKRYEFDKRPRRIEEFYDQCEFKQYSKDSYFVKNRICTLPTNSGRITLVNNKLIKRTGELREEYEIKTASNYYRILKEEFKIDAMKEKIRH